MNDDNLIRGAFGQLGQTVKKAGQDMKNLPKQIVQDLGEQLSAKQNSEEKPATNKAGWASDEERIKFLKDLYGKSDISKDGGSDPGKTPEEQKKLLELRNQLHKENYYDPTFNPVKKQEERPAEKVENEKKQEMQELQEKETKKPPPLAVQRAQKKTEMFPGSGG
ncbi:MAG: hypothetical protein HY424_00440 [Candidatus Levybacteria bacterium]|nr:hypothetical protein [Candidatus Levybacteria bacterium]